MAKKRATIDEVRPTRPDDGEFFAPCTWLAIDSEGRRFGSDSAEHARELAEAYNEPKRAPRARAAA